MSRILCIVIAKFLALIWKSLVKILKAMKFSKPAIVETFDGNFTTIVGISVRTWESFSSTYVHTLIP